eukprot:g6675.t1 g6675   contig23:1002137-1002733(-)
MAASFLSSLSIGTSTTNAAPLNSKAPSNTDKGNMDSHAYQRSQHRNTITLVHSKTLILAKTVQKYQRKHRDLSGVLDDAVEALDEFKDVEWPPKRADVEGVLAVPSWMGEEEEERGDEDGHVQRDDGSMSELARKLEQSVALDGSSVSVGEGSSVEGSRESSTHGKERSAAADAALGEELEDADVHDEEELEKCIRKC